MHPLQSDSDGGECEGVAAFNDDGNGEDVVGEGWWEEMVGRGRRSRGRV